MECSEVEEGLPVMAECCLAFTGSGTGALWARLGAQVGCKGRARGWPRVGRWQGPLGWSSSRAAQGVKVRVLEDGTDGPGLGKRQEGPWW